MARLKNRQTDRIPEMIRAMLIMLLAITLMDAYSSNNQVSQWFILLAVVVIGSAYALGFLSRVNRRQKDKSEMKIER